MIIGPNQLQDNYGQMFKKRGFETLKAFLSIGVEN
jgi:hypothetical protein